jgi:hypothetical protein
MHSINSKTCDVIALFSLFFFLVLFGATRKHKWHPRIKEAEPLREGAPTSPAQVGAHRLDLLTFALSFINDVLFKYDALALYCRCPPKLVLGHHRSFLGHHQWSFPLVRSSPPHAHDQVDGLSLYSLTHFLRGGLWVLLSLRN